MPAVVAAVATVAATITVEAVVTFVGKLLISAGISRLLARGQPDAPVAMLERVSRGAAMPRRVVFGTVKTSGIEAYKGIDAQKRMHQVLYVCEGPIQGIKPTFWVGDLLSTDSKFSGLITSDYRTGTTTQTAFAGLIADIPGEWTANHRGLGCAVSYHRFTFDRNAFTAVPEPVYEVEGALLYDPRSATTTFSNNSALAMLHVLRAPWGLACPDSMIDFDSFITAANVCDELVVTADTSLVVGATAGRVRRYTINGLYELAFGPAAIKEAIESSCNGRLIFSGGKYSFYAGAYRAPTLPTITPHFFRDGAMPEYQPYPGRASRATMIRGIYRDPKQNWQEVDFPPVKSSPAILVAEGEITTPIALPSVTNAPTAQRLAKQALWRSRARGALKLPCNWAALAYGPYQTCHVDFPELGISPALTWRVDEWTFNPVGGFDLLLVPDDADAYAWDYTVDETIPTVQPAPSWALAPPMLANITLGQGAVDTEGGTRVYLLAGWDAPNYPFVKYVEVQYRRDIDLDWLNGGQTSTNLIQIFDIEPTTLYVVRARIIALDERVGPWSSSSGAVNGDTVAPQPPSSASVISGGAHVLEWVNAADADLRAVRIYTVASSANDSPAQISSAFAMPLEPQHAEFSLPAGTHYALSSVDTSGNESALLYAGVGTTSSYVSP